MLELLCHTSVAKFFLWGGLCYRPISPRPVQNYRKQRQSLLGSLSLWCCPCLLPVLPFELKSIKEREKLPAGFLRGAKDPLWSSRPAEGMAPQNQNPEGVWVRRGPTPAGCLEGRRSWPGAWPPGSVCLVHFPVSQVGSPHTIIGPLQPPSPHPDPVFTACSFLLHSFPLGTTLGVSVDFTLEVNSLFTVTLEVYKLEDDVTMCMYLAGF